MATLLRAVVSGAASGLGKATATRIAELGGRVVVMDLATSDGAAVAAELGDNVFFHPTDVTNEDDVAAALDLAESSFGAPINTAVNCAGIGVAMTTLSRRGVHPLADFVKCLTVNTVGVRCCVEHRAALRRVTLSLSLSPRLPAAQCHRAAHTATSHTLRPTTSPLSRAVLQRRSSRRGANRIERR